MTFEVLVRVVATVSIVLAVAWVTTVLMRRRSAASRHAVWSAAVIAALVLPVGAFYGPAWELQLLDPAASEAPAAPATERETGTAPEIDMVPEIDTVPQAAQAALAPVATVDPAVPAARSDEARSEEVPAVATASAVGVGTSGPGASAGPVPSVSRMAVLAVAWAVGFTIWVARLVAGVVTSWWTVRRAARLTDPAWSAALAEAAERLGLRSAVTLRVAERATMPAVHGAWSATLVLPPQAVSWGPERRRIVLLHELAHVLRRDVAVQMMARLASAVHWFNPLAHLAVRRLRLEQERACDDAVLACGATGPEYADHLVGIAQDFGASLIGARGWSTVGMARPTQLESRLRAILDPGADRRAFSFGGRALLAASVMVVALPLATLRVTAAGAAPAQAPGTAEPRAVTAVPAPTRPEPVPGVPGTSPAIVTTAVAPVPAPAGTARVAVAPGGGPAATAPAVAAARTQAAVAPVPAPAPAAVQTAQSQAAEDTRRRAVAALTTAVGDEDENVRLQAVRALAGLGGSEAVDALTRALQDDSPRIRAEAAQSLGAVAHGVVGDQQREAAMARELQARERELAITSQRSRFEAELAALRAQLERSQAGSASAEALRRELDQSAVQRRDLESRLRDMERALAEARRELEQARQR